MENASLYEDNKFWDFRQGWDVDTQHLHSELSVTVPHGDGEHTLMVFLINGQLLMGTLQRKTKDSLKMLVSCYVTTNQSDIHQTCETGFLQFKMLPATPVQSSTWAQSSFWTISKSGSGGVSRTRWISSPFLRH